MEIFNLFITFVNAILNFEIMNIRISAYLLTVTIIIIIFYIIKSIAK